MDLISEIDVCRLCYDLIGYAKNDNNGVIIIENSYSAKNFIWPLKQNC